MLPSIEFLLYTAGLFDGEGSICLTRSTKNRGLQLTVTIVNTNRLVLEWIKAEFGKGYIYSRKPRILFNKQPSKSCHQLMWLSQQAEDILRLLLPHLHIKKAEAEIALAYRATIGRGRGRQNKLSAETLQVREALRENLMALR